MLALRVIRGVQAAHDHENASGARRPDGRNTAPGSLNGAGQRCAETGQAHPDDAAREPDLDDDFVQITVLQGVVHGDKGKVVIPPFSNGSGCKPS